MTKKDMIWLKCMNMGKKYGCHQRADRSFFIGNYQFPVCARCTGIIIAVPIALVMYWFAKISINVCIILIMIMGIDGGLQYFKIKESTNIRRFITGCIGGVGLSYIKISVICVLIEKIEVFFSYMLE